MAILSNQILLYKPSPGGVIYVLLQFDKTFPSFTTPIPNLLALPSNPRETTIMLSEMVTN